MRFWNTLLSLHNIRGFDEGGGETRFDVPFDVAVEELDTWVIDFEAEDDVAV